jgi:hypothetical protein
VQLFSCMLSLCGVDLLHLCMCLLHCGLMLMFELISHGFSIVLELLGYEGSLLP